MGITQERDADDAVEVNVNARMKQRPLFVLFDLDGCLYPIENGYEGRCRERVFEFMREQLNYGTIEGAKNAWAKEFKVYNQTLKSLRKLGHTEFKKELYWERTRGRAEEFLRCDLEVCECLKKMKCLKFVLTNCAEKQARECLEQLGIEDEFEEVYGADFMGDSCKPEKEAIERVLRDVKKRFFCRPQNNSSSISEEPFKFKANEVFFFEDSLKNLASAKANFNITGVLVKGKTLLEEEEEEEEGEKNNSTATAGTNYSAKEFKQIKKPSIKELEHIYPELFL